MDRKLTPREKGEQFEERVVVWARRHFASYRGEVRRNVQLNGKAVRVPYQIDVHVHTPKDGFFGSEHDIAIECRNRLENVKRADISNQIAVASDIYFAADSGREEFFFDRLIFASTSDFVDDALRHAKQYGSLAYITMAVDIEYLGQHCRVLPG